MPTWVRASSVLVSDDCEKLANGRTLESFLRRKIYLRRRLRRHMLHATVRTITLHYQAVGDVGRARLHDPRAARHDHRDGD